MQDWQFHRYAGDVYENMAIDEYLFQTAAETGERFLRVFDFDQDGYALGVNESVDDLKLDAITADGVDFTRRETAGSVINCDASATYFSFIVPAAPGDYKTDLNAEYGPVLRDTVVAMGLDPVQTRIADRGGVKMRRPGDEQYRAGIGSCQVARDGAALYHGALYLEPPTDVDRYVDLRSSGDADEASFVQEFFGIADELDISPQAARQRFATELPEHVPGSHEEFQLSPAGQDAVTVLAAEKYRSDRWRRRDGDRGTLRSGLGLCPVDQDGDGFY